MFQRQGAQVHSWTYKQTQRSQITVVSCGYTWTVNITAIYIIKPEIGFHALPWLTLQRSA